MPSIFRIVLASFVLLFFCGAASPVQYWDDGIFADFGLSAKATLPTETPYEGTIGVRKSIEKASFFGGICIDDFGLDVAGSFLGIPLKLRFFSLGVGYLTHLSRAFVSEVNPNLTTWENVFLLTNGFSLGKNPANPLVIACSLGLNVSKSYLQLTENRLEFHEVSPVFEFQLSKRFLMRHEIMFRFATYDLLHFRNFVNLWWQLGYSCDITKRFAVGGVAEVVYTDQVFLSGAINGFQAKAFVVYRL